ncbi:MAG: glycosyltransferase family 2 protein [Nitrospinae bacterium]|nr:glycosyltransferase family 2 protein [Nitrospinota bacterium]
MNAAAPATADAPSLSFIIPTLNEEKNLPDVIAEIVENAEKSGVSDYEMIIVDGGSADGTVETAENICARNPGVSLVRGGEGQGVGSNFLRGVRVAKKRHCLIVPGDNEFNLDFLPKAASLLSSAAPPAMVVTHVENSSIRPLHRRIISALYINIFNFLFSTNFKYTNGIVVYPVEWIRSLELCSTGYSFQSEALLTAHRQGKRFVQLGMRMRPRRHGRSKALSIAAVVEVFLSLAKMRLAHKKATPSS